MLKRIVLGGLVAAVLGIGPAVAETELVYGSWAPDTAADSVAITDFFKKVESESGGILTFEPSFGGTVVNIKTGMAGTRDRLVDVANIAGSLTPAELKGDMMITDFAMIKPVNTYALSAAVTETELLNCPQCWQEWTANSIIPMAFSAAGPFFLYCKDPVADPTKMSGMSVRAAGPTGIFAESLGASTTYVAPGEIYDLMQRGAVQCAIASSLWLRAYSLWDFVKYVLDYSVGQYNNGAIFAINSEAWKELDDAQKKAVTDNLPYLVWRAAKANWDEYQAVRKASGDKGVEWVAASPEFVEHTKTYAAGEPDRVVKTAVEKGVADAQAYVNSLQESLAWWNKFVEEHGEDETAYVAALKERIYDKVKF